MRFVSVRRGGCARTGVVDGGEIVLLPVAFGDLVEIAEQGAERLGAIRAELSSSSAERVALDGAELLSPVSRFRRDVLCTGWNYWDHFEEGRSHRPHVERPIAPAFFTKAPDTVIGPRDPIAFDPRISAKWDYEAEIVVIIGRTGRSIPRARAMDHVFGYCLANDVSARDLQRRHGTQWMKGKALDRTMPLGPVVVTSDEIDLQDSRLQCFVNGEMRQDAAIAQMAFPIPDLIAELSFGMTLHAGDVLLTGTPSGVGNARKPPVYLQAGDEIVVLCEAIGELRNEVRQTDLYGEADIIIQ